MDEPAHTIDGEDLDPMEYKFDDLDLLLTDQTDNYVDAMRQYSQEKPTVAEKPVVKVPLAAPTLPRMVGRDGRKFVKLLGQWRPDYDAMDASELSTLRIKIVAQLANDRSSYQSMGIRDDATLMAMPMQDLHTYYSSVKDIINARSATVFYTNTIYGATLIIERLATRYGYDIAKGFSERSVAFASLFNSYTNAVAIEEEGSGGGFSSLSPTMRMGMMWSSCLVAYCLFTYMMGNDAGSALYEIVADSIKDRLPMADMASKLKGANAARDGIVVDELHPEAAPAKQPKTGSVLDKLEKYANIADRLLGAQAPAPQQQAKRPATQARRRPGHRQ